MFTGIINEIGVVSGVVRRGDGIVLTVKSQKVSGTVELGDSVAVNGVCLSVTKLGTELTFDAVGNTLKNTNLKKLKKGDKINLENAAKFGDDISGHLVSGHVDCNRPIISTRKSKDGWIFDIRILSEDKKYVVPKGSISLDGVSLTISEVHDNFVRIYLIPITLEETTLKNKKTGYNINIEFDTLGKYAANAKKTEISNDLLRKTGFM